jgi:CRISPR-associated protein Csy2
MEYSYILIPHMVVQDANAQPTQLLIGAPPPTAYLGWAHNLARNIGASQHEGVAIIHHDIQFLGEVDRLTLNPNQYRAASFVDQSDYAGTGTRPVLSSQPTARCHLEVSVAVRFDADESLDIGKVDGFLRGGRLAGGSIIDHRFDPTRPSCNLRDQADTRALRQAIGSGFALHERQDLMIRSDEDADLLDTLLRVTRQNGTDEENADRTWLQPTSLGYAQITPLAARQNARECLPHAFAESLIGLVQYRPLRDFGLPFWQYTHPAPGVFLASTSQQS